VVERRVDVRDARRDVLALAPTNALLCGFLAHARPCCGSLRKSPVRPNLLSARNFRLLLLARDGFRRTLARAGVGMGALAAHRQAAAMPQPAIAAEIHQPLDIELDFAPQVTLDHVVAVDQLADVQHFLVGELRHAPLRRMAQLLHDLGRLFLLYAMDVLQRDDDALVGRKVDTSDTSHFICSCSQPCWPLSPNRSPERTRNAATTPPPRPGP